MSEDAGPVKLFDGYVMAETAKTCESDCHETMKAMSAICFGQRSYREFNERFEYPIEAIGSSRKAIRKWNVICKG